MSGSPGWWRSSGRRFAVAALGAAVVLSCAGWATPLRALVHTAVVVGGTRALLAGGAATGVGGLLTVAGRRHPRAAGILAGLLLGAVVLVALVFALVVPRELRTARTLVELQGSMEGARRRAGSYPPPDLEGHLRLDGASPSLDGFGRPLAYHLTSRWQVATYRLTSLGYDGRASDDDLCVEGGTRPAVVFADAGRLEALLASVAPGAPIEQNFAALRALHCPEGRPAP